MQNKKNNIQNERKTVLLTIEHKEREFFAKCFLAYMLAKKGFRVYIGNFGQIDLVTKRINSGIFFHKSSFAKKSQLYKKRGFKFVFLDEEGGISIPKSRLKEFCDFRYHEYYVSKEKNDIIFLPGKYFYEIVKSMPNTKNVKLVTSGWPRFDLCRSEFSILYQKDIERINKKFGTFYLVITSFGMTSKREYIQRMKSSTTQFQRQIRKHKYIHFLKYVYLIKKISTYLKSDEKIIIRPHPSESVQEWNKIIKNCKNTFAIRDGDIAPWILASNGVIQYSSTANIQAGMVGKSSVQYKVEKKIGLTDSSTCDISFDCQTSEEVYKTLRMNRDKVSQNIIDRTKSILAEEMAYDENEYSAAKIANYLNEIDIRKKAPCYFSFFDRIRSLIRRYYSIYLHIKFKKILRSNKKTSQEKIPGGIKKQEVKNLFDQFKIILSDNFDYSIKSPCRNLISVEKHE